MTQYAFYFDATRCTGCKTCVLACKDYYDLSLDVSYRKIYHFGGGQWSQNEDGSWSTNAFGYYVSEACNHCDDPACTKVCPTKAMHKSADTGLVTVDASRCIGCGYCHMACPYNVPKVDRSLGHSVKCTGCADRVQQGLNPICVDSCTYRAIHFGPVEDMEQMGERAAIAPLPDPKFTHPNLYIKSGEVQRPFDTDEGMILNTMEVK